MEACSCRPISPPAPSAPLDIDVLPDEVVIFGPVRRDKTFAGFSRGDPTPLVGYEPLRQSLAKVRGPSDSTRFLPQLTASDCHRRTPARRTAGPFFHRLVQAKDVRMFQEGQLSKPPARTDRGGRWPCPNRRGSS